MVKEQEWGVSCRLFKPPAFEIGPLLGQAIAEVEHNGSGGQAARTTSIEA
jgi:hypothetical protein